MHLIYAQNPVSLGPPSVGKTFFRCCLVSGLWLWDPHTLTDKLAQRRGPKRPSRAGKDSLTRQRSRDRAEGQPGLAKLESPAQGRLLSRAGASCSIEPSPKARLTADAATLRAQLCHGRQ